jgi:spore coat polysaccharide biosynthesis protein SpsF
MVSEQEDQITGHEGLPIPGLSHCLDSRVSKTTKAIAIIQARSSSNRLPGKVLKPLAGYPMIWHVVQRAEACRLVDQVIVATSTEPSDDNLAAFCREAGLNCYRGSLSNVLSRYIAVLDMYPQPAVVRITGDCPLIHPPFIDRQIELLYTYDADMICLDKPASLLEGQGVHSSRSLRRVAEQSNHPDDFEHVGSRFFCENPELFRIVRLSVPHELSGTRWRLTVDEEADYALVAKLYEALYQGEPIALDKVVHFLENHPGLASMNNSVEHSAINQELAAKRETAQVPVLATIQW